MERSKRAEPAVSPERAELITRFYREHEGRHPAPILRALAFRELCEQQTIYIGDDELIVGERGPSPKAVPTFPELTCHSVDDLRTLDARPHTRYRTDAAAVAVYEREIIPYWQGSMIAVSHNDVKGLDKTLDPTFIMRFWLLSK